MTIGCETMRPPGAFSADDEAAVSVDEDDDGATGDQVADTSDDIYRGIADPDVSDDDDPAGPTDGTPTTADALVGDYWMRADLQVKLAASQLGVSVKTTTDTSVYSLVTVRAKGDALELRDWQCTMRVVQSCQSGCSKMTTVLRDVASSGKAFMAPRRKLTVASDGHWSVAPVAYAVGFKGDYATTPDIAIPAQASDPLVYDPDGGGKGIDFVTSVQSGGLSASCALRVVQKVAVRYEGELERGALASGALIDFGSEQTVLSNTCDGTATDPTPGAPATLRMVRAKQVVDTSKVPWTCPSLAEFEAALPND